MASDTAETAAPATAAPATPVPAESLHRRLIESVTDYAIYMLDLEGRVSSWNAGAQRFKGYREPEVLGRHFSMFYIDEDRRNGKPASILATALRDGRVEDTGWRLRKDGRQFWAHVVVDLVRDDAGRPVGFAKITRDVSERRAADLRLRELTRSHEELEQFVHIASHDLREPLRKVLAFADLLELDDGERLSPGGRDSLRSIVAATRRMQDLLASLMDLTRVTSEGRSFDPCDLRQCALDVCSDLAVAIAEKQARVEIGPLPQIEADGVQMRQLFQNLVENSIKYARAGVPPQVRLAEVPDPDPDCASVACEDNGIGFEARYAERIFGVFQRLHTREAYAGAGIGLSICRKICGRHGGSIRAEGSPGQGARFLIRLPRRHRPDAC